MALIGSYGKFRLRVLPWVLLALLLPTAARAEGYGDWFLYDVAKIHSSVLTDAIGLVAIVPRDPQSPAWQGDLLGVDPALGEQRPPDNIRFPTFKLRHGKFFPAGELAAGQTKPASFGGYGGYVKYLVTARRGQYVQVVVEPTQNRRVWIRPDKAVGDNLFVFAELVGKAKPVEGEIDIFLLAPEVKVYTKPTRGAPFQELRHQEQERWEENIFYPIAFTRDYVQIGRRRLNEKSGDPYLLDGPPLGWIRIRDATGRLAFYLFICTWD